MKFVQKIAWVFSHEIPCTSEEYKELKVKYRVAETMSKEAQAETAVFKAGMNKLYQLITEAQDLELLNVKSADVMKRIRSATGHIYKPDYIPERILWNYED